MKTYDQLTPEQQMLAHGYCYARQMQYAIEYPLEYEGEPGLYARIKAAHKKADQMQTPWFAHEYIADTCRDDLMAIAVERAKRALYAERSDGEVIEGIA